MTVTDPFEIIYTHLAKTLPDSIAERRKVLQAMSYVLKDSHPAKASVLAILAALDAQDKLQMDLSLTLTRGQA
jgi:hypothetical protein